MHQKKGGCPITKQFTRPKGGKKRVGPSNIRGAESARPLRGRLYSYPLGREKASSEKGVLNHLQGKKISSPPCQFGALLQHTGGTGVALLQTCRRRCIRGILEKLFRNTPIFSFPAPPLWGLDLECKEKRLYRPAEKEKDRHGKSLPGKHDPF